MRPTCFSGRSGFSEPALAAHLIEIWAQVLRRETREIDPQANFFAIGGDSLQLVQVMAQVNEQFFAEEDASLPITDFFTYTSVASLARHIATRNQPEQATSQIPSSSRGTGDVAIIGMNGRFPGAETVEAFWQNLRASLETSRQSQEANQSFDADYFGITPREAALMCPEQRMLLECAEELLQIAGYGVRDSQERVGVFVGAGPAATQPASPELTGGFAEIVANTSPATRLAYLLDLKGPSFSIDTACSSSLVAVHLACQSLLRGECELALAGGVSSLRPVPAAIQVESGNMHSPTGRCRPFDDAADGAVFTAGAGLVLLKRLDEAVRDRDTICAVIRGSAINNDGRAKVGYTAPSVTGQIRVIRDALAAASVAPGEIRYIETHGTGTRLGDPIEVAALQRALSEAGAPPVRCALGALKANVGHLEAAAGVAGLIKTALVVRNREIPPAIHFRSPNREIDFTVTPFYLNAESERLTQADGQWYAGVSSFGIGGTNAHAVVAAPPITARRPEPDTPCLLVLSARSSSALSGLCSQVAAHLTGSPEQSLADAAFTLQRGRARHAHRCHVVATSPATAAEKLRSLLEGAAQSRQPTSNAVAFMFPGQGSQYVGMAANFHRVEREFRDTWDQCADLVRAQRGPDLHEFILGDARSAELAQRLARTSVCQPALFAVEYALARLLIARGIQPAMMIGHSVGEYVAACLAGVLSLEDALRLVVVRGRLMEAAPPGAMLAVAMSAERARDLLGTQCSLAAVNASESCVISGPRWAIAALEQDLQRAGFSGKRLSTSGAFHSRLMDEVVPEFSTALESVRFGTPSIPYVSNVTGQLATAHLVGSPDYWLRHLRETVQFHEGLQTLKTQGCGVFLEVGPGRVLTALASRSLGQGDVATMHADLTHSQSVPEPEHVKELIGRLWCAGAQIDWAAFNAGEERGRVPLPAHPFERRPLVRALVPAAHELGSGLRSADPSRCLYEAVWQRVPPSPLLLRAESEPLADCCVLVEDPSDLGEHLVRALRRRYRQVLRVQAASLPLDTAAAGRAVDVVCAWRRAVPQDWIFSVRSLCHALHSVSGTCDVRLILLTQSAYDIVGTETVEPANAMAAAVAGVIAKELPRVRCRTLDIQVPKASADCEQQLIDLCENVAAEIARTEAPELLALRGPVRWRRRFVTAPAGEVSAGSAALLRDDGVYLITGGSGGIGLAAAEALAESCRARIVLVSRSMEKRTPQLQRTHEVLAGKHAHVMTFSADVADETRVDALVEQVVRQWSRIDGVIHAAGIAGNGTLLLKTEAAINAVLRPKIDGTVNLWRAVRPLQPDFFLCCSSLSAVLAAPGQFDYAAANAFQDAFAHAQDGKTSTRFISVNWDAWRDVGMAVDAQTRSSAERPIFDLSLGLTREEGKAIIKQVLRQPRTQWLVSTTDLGAKVAQEPTPKSQASPPDTPSAPNNLEASVTAIWQELLGREQIGLDEEFLSVGGDSLLLVRLGSEIHKRLGLRISPRDLMRHSTIAGIVKLVRV